MFGKKYLYLMMPVMACLTFNVFADTNPDMTKFYSDENNRQAFENAKRRGLVKKSREQIHTTCLKQKNPSLDCKCMARKMKKVPADEFFYESTLSFMEYQEKVQALKSKNEKLYQKLEKKYAKRTSLPKRIEKKCKKGSK